MTALIIIDVQNDFIPGGSLAVPLGDEIIVPINQMQHDFDLVVATQDWHPADHCSFASQHPGRKLFETIELQGHAQTLWPDHCVQGTSGAEISPLLNINPIEAIFKKGTNPSVDSYSAFYDNARTKSTGLASYLRGKEIKAVFLCGLAGDVCVYFSAIDGLREGFKTTVITSATRALEVSRFEAQMQELVQRGGNVL